MATTIVRNAFHGGPLSHINLMVASMAGLTVSQAIAIGTKYTGTIEKFLPNSKITVRLNPMAVPGSYGLILRSGTTIT